MLHDSQTGGTVKAPEGFSFDLDLSMIDRMYRERIGSGQAQTPVQKKAQKEEIEDQEYDPAKPNDYSEVLKERLEAIEDVKRQAEDNDFRIRQNLVDTSLRHAPIGQQVQILDEDGPLIDQKIIKMLEKQGWKYGKGIGAEEDGILNPLIAVKTSSRTAVLKQSGQNVGLDLAVKNLIVQAPGSQTPSMEPHPVQSQGKTVIYSSGPVIDDPRIVPIQDKYLRA